MRGSKNLKFVTYLPNAVLTGFVRSVELKCDLVPLGDTLILVQSGDDNEKHAHY